MDKYLETEFGFRDLDGWLKSPDEIKDTFMDMGISYEYFDCGQGYYQDEALVKAYLLGKCYEIKLHADIESSKQDRGDRLYWVECIKHVSFREVDKPAPRERGGYTLEIEGATAKDIKWLQGAMEREGLKFKIKNK